MPNVVLNGIQTRYEVIGSGAPLLMFSPGGFDATLEKWSTLGIYAKTAMLEPLTRNYQCIVFDRRECGQSGGRVEAIGWQHYVAQGAALLDHLKIECAHLMGGCMGCCPVLAFAVAHPLRVRSMVLVWPVGGARYRINGQQRFAQHLAYVREHGLAAVVALVRQERKAFNADPRGGPWATLLARDAAFAETYMALDLAAYAQTVARMAQQLLDRDTAPGAEPEDLLTLDIPALVVPGQDTSHATSAARYLQECLPRAEYWDLPPEQQLASNLPARMLQFLAAAHRDATP